MSVYSRLLLELLIEKILCDLLNNIDCSLYLFDFDLPNGVYKKIVFNKNTNVNVADDFGNTPLMWACRYEIINKVKLLLQHPDINVSFGDYGSALLSASYNGNVLIVSLLLNRIDIDVNAKDMCGDTALMEVCKRNYILIAKLLLSHPEIDVNAKDEDDLTALMLACYKNNFLIMNLLLQHPDIDVNAINKNNYTALEWSQQVGYKEPEELLQSFPGVITRLKKYITIS